MNALKLALVAVVLTAMSGCAYLVDNFNGQAQRDIYLQIHPNTPPKIAAAIKDGKVAQGMTMEQLFAVAGRENCHLGWGQDSERRYSIDKANRTYKSGPLHIDHNDAIKNHTGIVVHKGDVTKHITCYKNDKVQLWIVFDTTQDKLLNADWHTFTYAETSGPMWCGIYICAW